MNLNLYVNDGVRVNKTGEKLFVDIGVIENSNGDMHYNEALSISAYEVHQIFVVRKDIVIKLFIFDKDAEVIKSDFGWYSDGEIIFTNNKTWE